MSPANARQVSGATPRRGRAISSATAVMTSAAKAMSYRALAAVASTPGLIATITAAIAPAYSDESRRATSNTAATSKPNASGPNSTYVSR